MEPMGPAVQATDTGETEYTAPRAKSDAGKEVREVDVEKSPNGGYIARCSYKQKDDGKGRSLPYLESESFPFEGFSALVAFLAQKFGESTASPTAQGAPDSSAAA